MKYVKLPLIARRKHLIEALEIIDEKERAIAVLENQIEMRHGEVAHTPEYRLRPSWAKKRKVEL